MPAPKPQPTAHLTLSVDGRMVEAHLIPGSPTNRGPKQPRWMLQIDGGQTIRGPLTWDPIDLDVERGAIADHVRERARVALEYVTRHGEYLERMREAGLLDRVAHALGVYPTDLTQRA